MNTPMIRQCMILSLLLVGATLAAEVPAQPDAQRLTDLLGRTGDRTSLFLDQFSDVKCTEQVRQEKLGKDD